MYIVAIGWMFVVGCMAAVEGVTSSVAGGIVTLFIYGLLPLALFLWLVGTPQRHRNRMLGSARPKSGASFDPARADHRKKDSDDRDAQ
ncbi:MAG: hypothetical protein ACR2GP_13540 [Burkholderiaceae bacterium]